MATENAALWAPHTHWDTKAIVNFDQWAAADERAAEIATIEAELETAIEQRDQALAILWAIAERTSPDTVAAIEGELGLLRSLIEVGADEAAELLIKGDGDAE